MKPALLLLMFSCALACNARRSSVVAEAAGASPSPSPSPSASPSANRAVSGSIVVLGSSTSAGIGPKDPKQAWVARYRRYLAERFPNLTLVNLAVGGLTTFEIQPTDYVPPPHRPAPAVGKNITAALLLRPRAIIVNLPSNDQAGNFPLAEQLANYDRVANLSAAAHVPLWVSTTQPRNFDDPAQLASLIRARDAIRQKFAPRVLDFWTPFAAPNGFIQAQYNAGDGTHLNDAAHALLVGIVEGAHIPEQLAGI